MGGVWRNRPADYIPASELGVCTRCGLRRRINGAKKRKTRSTGLCRDCYLSSIQRLPSRP